MIYALGQKSNVLLEEKVEREDSVDRISNSGWIVRNAQGSDGIDTFAWIPRPVFNCHGSQNWSSQACIRRGTQSTDYRKMPDSVSFVLLYLHQWYHHIQITEFHVLTGLSRIVAPHHLLSRRAITLLNSDSLALVLQTTINHALQLLLLLVPDHTLSKAPTVQMEFYVGTKNIKQMDPSSPRRCRLRSRWTVEDRFELP